MMLLQVSNEHKQNWKSDYANRSDPVYISRVVSAMVSNFSPSLLSLFSDCLSFFYVLIVVIFLSR